MHPLAAYLDERKLSQSDFAEIAGVSRTVLCRVLNGRRPRFSVSAALAIEAATNGRVGLRTLLGESVRGNRRSQARNTTAKRGSR